MSRDLVVIGSSWGGLVALETILRALPKDFGAAIAIAQHRSPDSGSGALGAMLGRYSALEVCEAGDKEPIEPGRVYIAPPDYHLYVEEGSFALDVDDAVQYSRPSIDVLFDSAADVYGERLAAVILTGANQDGAYGITRVRRRGGLTIAQDPATAAKREMPAAAIATGAVDRVLPLDEIGPVLASVSARDTNGSRA
ncbi:MAG: two-component system, chemotaxis family, protein-glutamate methylesterase/glutaminase [Thermoleophilaceae bacterium]|nr:two-component system, chemotaxis family, protein-glutamate methylesterase/glutaminase [Thermoleophilaceae bacterium]